MDTRLRVLEKMERQLAKKAKELRELIYARPLSEIIKIRKGFHQIIAKHGGMSQEACDYADKFANEEQKQFRIAKKQQAGHLTDITKLVELEHELHEVRNEIFMLKARKGKC